MPEMADWNLHYPDNLIADGAPHRRVGDIFDWFAVQFWSLEKMVRSERGTRSAERGRDYHHVVTAEVVFLAAESDVVIDFGIRAIGDQEKLPKGIALGDFVEGEISLHLPLAINVIPHEVITTL